jgi:hypothetical protein
MAGILVALGILSYPGNLRYLSRLSCQNSTGRQILKNVLPVRQNHFVADL